MYTGRRKGRMASHVPEQAMRMNNKAAVIDANLIPNPQQAIVLMVAVSQIQNSKFKIHYLAILQK